MLKLKLIVEVAKLDLWTTQYVLKKSTLIGGLPEGGSQGKHRLFTIEQAVRLAVHTHLVMGGVILEPAVEAVKYCNQIVKQFTANRAVSYQLVNPEHRWLISVVDSRYVNIWSEHLRSKAKLLREGTGKQLTLDIEQEYYDTKTGEVDFDNEVPLTRFTLDATMLENRLVNARD